MGASIVKVDGTALVFDATPRIAYARSVRTTDHPIEDGSTITDHAQAEPLIISITGIVSETPLAASSSTTGGTARVLAAIDFLRSCEGELVSVVDDRLGTTPDCLLTRYPYGVDQVRRQEFGIELKQVEIATAGSVMFAAAVPPVSRADLDRKLGQTLAEAEVAKLLALNAQIAAAQDTGAQPTSDSAADPSAEARDTSALLDLALATGAL